MDPTTDRDTREMIETLRWTAEMPLGLTSRLEASVLRRARAPAGFTLAEKCCLASAALIPFIAGGAGDGFVLLLVAAAGVVGYLQWTILVEDAGSA